jgi:putative ABC transport system ATP-binding protein
MSAARAYTPPRPEPASGLSARPASPAEVAVRIEDLTKVYALKGETVHALRGVSFEVPRGDYIAIMGPSGSGKSTLLNLLACLDRPSAGRYWLGGDDVSRMNDDDLSHVRASRIGIIFQSYNLIQQLTVLENIEVPLHYLGRLNRQTRERCRELAERVGLGSRLGHRPNQLSGGQQQRVAIARSLVNDPQFVLADEATGNLDSHTTAEILALFEELNQEGRTLILVTHEDDVAQHAKRVLRLRDGLVQFDHATENRIVATPPPPPESI